ncbi:MAG: thioredoxin family protein [Ignavibacteria bacterium]|jgi:thiol:disulfide interchange protein
MRGKINILFAVLLFVAGWNSVVYTQIQSDIVSVNLGVENLKAAKGTNFTTILKVEIKHGWHINSNKPNDEFLIPSEITAESNGIKLANVKYPEAHILALEFSEKPVSVYEGKEEIELTFAVEENASIDKLTVEVKFEYQACNDKTCMPPTSITDTITVEIKDNKKTVSTSPGKILKEKEKEQVNKEKSKPSVTVKQEETHTQKVEEKTDTVQNIITKAPLETTQLSGESITVFAAIAFAFLGGIILNLMPCVLPVLSLKIMGIIEQAGEAPREKLKHGLLFTFGVLVSFWILAGLLLVLRAGGEQLGWGFQLQSPGFVIVLSIFLFLFGLSMFGVFEIGTTLTAVGQGKKNRSAYMGSFTSGVLATVVATPCTAPFMGSALGFALSQPAYVSLLVFTILGLGMAAPYLVLTSIPKLLRFIPKPGAWMETMKQFMGFLLMATVLWLLWVLSLQTGSEGVIILLASLILISISGWIYGRWGNIAKEIKVRRTAQVAAALILIVALSFSLKNIEAKTSETTGIYIQGTIEWQQFSPELVEELRLENKPVFIDFTAAWCLSCQVNEEVAFGSEEVQKAFAEKGIVTLKADWTNKDETITKALAEFGRNSVPLYVYYAPGEEVKILPEIITAGIVLEYLGSN